QSASRTPAGALVGVNPYVFIVGCARSGTTLMHRIVDAHPQIAISPEMHWITRQFKGRNALVTPELVTELTGHKRFAQFEIPREEFEGLLGSAEAIPYPTFLRRLFDLYGKINNKPLVGNKTSGYVRRIPTFHALWPEAKFVHIIRDGRDVCLSVLNWKKAERTAGRYASWEEDPVTTTALWWERKVRKAREDGAALGPALYHETLYEDLVEDPERECKRLCEFLGVPYDDAMIRFHEGRERVEPGRGAKSAWLRVTSGLRDWRTQMAAGDVERFEAAAGDLLEELGYERAVPNPSSEALEQAARIREAFTREPLASGDQPPGSWAT
ncbi:MAG TPA: sulfotransferase, partial [Rubrobacter sp.]|nr:sulfotransferase [Rubrobacter sp.]